MKRALLTLVLGLIMINFVSAAYYGGGFSLSDLLNEIDADTMILGAVLIISFALINFSLSKVFKDRYGEPNRPIAGIVAFVIALLITWGINRTGFDFGELFYGIGFSENFLFIFLPLLLIGGIIFLGFKFGFGITLITLGVLFIALGSTSFLYETGMAIIIGIILLALGIFIQVKWPKKKKSNPNKPYHWGP